MPSRPKFFLTLLGLCLAPLLLLAAINYFNGLQEAESELLRDLDRELNNFIATVSDHVDEQENELIPLADSKTLHDYLKSPPIQSASPANDPVVTELKNALAATLSKQSHFVNISFFDKQKRPVFPAERKPEERASEGFSFRTQDFPPGLPRPDEGVWAATEPLRSPVSITSSGTSLRISVPVFLQNEGAETSRGASWLRWRVRSIVPENFRSVRRCALIAQRGHE